MHSFTVTASYCQTRSELRKSKEKYILLIAGRKKAKLDILFYILDLFLVWCALRGIQYDSIHSGLHLRFFPYINTPKHRRDLLRTGSSPYILVISEYL